MTEARVPAPSAASKPPKAGCQRGQSTVEFALVFPLVLSFLLGLTDFGRGVAAYVALAECAREAARAGIYTVATDNDIRSAARAQAGILGDIPDPGISITPAFPRASGDVLQVTVRYDFNTFAPLINQLWGGGPIAMTGESSMRVE